MHMLDIRNIVKKKKKERTQQIGWVENFENFIISQDKLLPQKHVTWVCEVLPVWLWLTEGRGHVIILFMILIVP